MLPLNQTKKWYAGGKKAEPTPEELEFIYSKIEDKLSDSEILEEMQSEAFLLRTPGSIKRRRREYYAAKRVFEALVNKKLDPAITRQRIRHWNELAEAAKKLKRNIDLVKRSEEELFGNILSGWVSTSALVIFNDKHKTALERVDSLVAEGLLSHLKAEFKQFDAIEGWRLLTKQDIERIITKDMLRKLDKVSHRKTFRDSCTICRSWG